MKTRILKTLLPVIFGIIAVLALLFIYNVIINKGISYNYSDRRFYTLFIPIAIIAAITIQFVMYLPFWEIYKIRKKILGLRLVPFTGLLTIVSGLIFGIVFWETSSGIKELVLLTITGIIAFAVYWSVNLLTVRQLDKI